MAVPAILLTTLTFIGSYAATKGFDAIYQTASNFNDDDASWDSLKMVLDEAAKRRRDLCKPMHTNGLCKIDGAEVQTYKPDMSGTMTTSIYSVQTKDGNSMHIVLNNSDKSKIHYVFIDKKNNVELERGNAGPKAINKLIVDEGGLKVNPQDRR
jgi:hypothetical protein